MKRRNFLLGTLGSVLGTRALPLLERELRAQEGFIESQRALSRTGYVFDEVFLEHVLERSEFEVPARLTAIRKRLNESGLVNELRSVLPLAEPDPFLAEVHSEEHRRAILELPGTGRVARAAVAGALGAVSAVCEGEVRNAFCALRPPGHHALNTGEEEGFCYFANAAIAARYAQTVHGLQRVLIIDWDYHHGNGTEAVFYREPGVLYFSTHNWHDYPGTGDPGRTGEGPGRGFNINVHLDEGATDEQVLRSWDENLLPRLDAFRPEIILVSAGFDGRHGDPLGKFRFTDDLYYRLTRLVSGLARQYCGGKLVSLLEGGYNLEGLASAVASHVRALVEDSKQAG